MTALLAMLLIMFLAALLYYALPFIWLLVFVIIIAIGISMGYAYKVETPIQLATALNDLTGQLHRINNGYADTLDVSSQSPEIMQLATEIQTHLSLESDRLVKEQSFSSDASHELRTPLSGMRLQAQVAQRTKDENQREKALEYIIEAVDRSTRLVQQLLIYSRLTKRRTQTEKSLLDMKEQLTQVLTNHMQNIVKKDLSLIKHFSEDTELLVDANKDQMLALLENILQNALEYTPDKGELRISLSHEQDRIKITVEDTGPGIVETDLERVVIPFQKSSDGSQEGTGLGLAICERVAYLHQGTMTLGNSALGGLLVEVTLPQAPMEPMSQQAG
jgi:two-component system sensor histidine kinase QseC